MVLFIHQGPKNRTLSEVDRRTIQKVSRRAGAATRKAKGPRPRINVLQVPDFLIPEFETKPEGSHLDNKSRDSSGTTPLYRQTGSHPQSPPPPEEPLAGRDIVVSAPASVPLFLQPHGSNIPEKLSVLMQPGLSQRLLDEAAIAGENASPRRWVKICRLTAMLHFLPQMIGQRRCLDHAIECLAERARQYYAPPTDRQLGQLQLERKYGRALQSLQNALTSTPKVDWTVWYTTLLLALFELLEHSSQHAWILHSQGAVHILAAIGPDNIKSEFEKTLLAAQCQIMIVEATFSNLDCFLSHPGWQRALSSITADDSQSPDRSEAVVALWMITARGPGLFQKVTEAVVHQHSLEEASTLAHALRGLLDEYSAWGAHWSSRLLGDESCDSDTILVSSQTDSSIMRRIGAAILPVYLAYWVLINRFLVAVEPSGGFVVEADILNAALRIIEIGEQRDPHAITDLCRSFAVMIARSIQATTTEWSRPADAFDVGETIEPRVFCRWNTLMGRVV